jgi:hypothetical protein
MNLYTEYSISHEELDEILSNHEICRVTVENLDFYVDLRGNTIKYRHDYEFTGKEKFILFCSDSEPNNISITADDTDIIRITGIGGYDYKIVLKSNAEIYIFAKRKEKNRI